MLLIISGRNMYLTLESTNEVIDVMLGGEICTSVLLT